MSEKNLQLEGLLPLINQQNDAAAKDFVCDISNFFCLPLTKAELDLAIEKLFSTTDGTVAFLNNSIRIRKHFQESNVLILTLWHNLLTEHIETVDFSTYILQITEICIKFITSNIGPSAKERERATVVLQVLVEKKQITDGLASTILNRALSVFNLKKPTELFTYEVFRLIGLLAKSYPQSVSDEQSQRIKVEYFKAMNTVMSNQQDIRFRAVSGALEGLNDYLTNFAPSPSDEQDTLNCIYACLKKLSKPADDIKQKSAFRAALELFKCHATLFSKQILCDFKHWQSSLETWLTSSIYDDRRRGVTASYAFHQIIANELKADSCNDHKDILQLILSEFRKTLESANSRPEETRIAIKGFGTMSQLCKRELPDILNDMISLVVQRCELILLADEDTMREVLKHLPDYIQALSTVVSEVKDPQISDIMVEKLQSIMIRLISDFHFLSKPYHRSVISSLRSAFQVIYLTDLALFERLLSKVIFEGVVWTCSHKHVFQANADLEEKTDWKNNITYKSYLPLWQELLFLGPDQNTLEKSSLSDKIFDQLILTLFKILQKLDLRTQKRVYTAEDGTDQQFYFCDPNFDLCPVRPKDFHIFINLVDFYRDLCPQFRRQRFIAWVDIFCLKMFQLSLRNPLVSGFLKLLEMGLAIADCFMDMTIFTPELGITLAHVLSTMIVRCQRVSGELQISILELLLQFPPSFYNTHLIDMIPIFKTAFDLGKSMTWLAHMAVECLEKISIHCDSDDLHDLYVEVLPLLDIYLQGHYVVEELSIREARVKHKLSKTTSKKAAVSDDNDIQTKIISFLEKLSPEAASLVVLNSVKDQVLVKWDTLKCIQLDLRLEDINPVIYLDTLVPHICQLALTSVDRQAKIAACEVVHALVLYLLGARAYQGQIWFELCKRMLMLGCDGDATVQQMFEPLLMQVMHFMSKYENLDRGVEEVMEALMAGISSKSNFGLRDLSASCLREFVEWSIKQTTPQQLAASPVSLEVILGKLKTYSFDSDGCKRVGAALAFNNLYRRLREEEAICDIFFVDLLHTFCINFKLSEELTTLPLTDDMNSDLEIISEALDHITRVLSERNYLYNKPSDRRLVPSAMNSGTLVDVVKFLIIQTGSRKMFYRRKCMKLAETLACKTDEYNSLEHYFESISMSDDDLCKICEGDRDGGGIQTWPTISFMIHQKQGYPEKLIYNWLEYFLKSIDTFTWFLRENAISPNSKIFANSKFVRVVWYYLDEVCWTFLPTILETHFPETPMIKDLLTAQNISTIKGMINISIFKFLTEFMHSKCYLMNGVEFWDSKVYDPLGAMLVQLLYEPDKLSIDYHFMNPHKEIETYVERFYTELGKSSHHKELHQQITTGISLGLTSRLMFLASSLEDMLRAEVHMATLPYYLKGILHVLKSPFKFTIIEPNQTCLKTTCECIARTCFDTMYRSCLNNKVVTNHPENLKKFARSLLSIAFDVHDLSNICVDLILDKTELYTPNLDARTKQGPAFLEKYESVINEQVTLSFFKKSFELLTRQTEEEQNYLLRVLTGVLEHRRKAHHDVSGEFGEIIKFCIQNLSALLQKLTDNTDDYHFIEFLSVLASISSTCSLKIKKEVPAIENWIIAKLRSAELNLEKKCKIISLLPILVGSQDYENHNVMNALEDLQRRHFPLKSTEFSRNSLEETSLKHAFVIVLKALVESKSYVVLEFLFKTTASDENHLMEDEIHKGIESFTIWLSKEQQIEVLKRTLDTVLNDCYEPLLRLTIFRRFFLNIFKYCDEDSLMTFLQNVIKRVNALLDANYRISNSGRAVEQALVNRIIGYGLIEYFFGTVRKDLYLTVDCPAAKELLGTPKTSNEFVGTFTKKAFYVRTEEFTTPSKETAELFRQYQCSAYCALCSLVSNTQTELKFYSKFLFEENSRKNEFIWARLVDCSSDKHYVHPGQELEEHTKVRKRFVAIRKLDVTPVVSLNAITSAKRFQTQNIIESSLSQDVRGIDMTSHSVRSYTEALRRPKIRSAEEAMSVRLEGNSLNKHEVMPMLCGLIKFMHTNNITPVITDTSIKRSYPWVQAIANAIESIDYNRNIRVFLAQVVDNCSDVFQQFAHVLFKPLLRMLADECAGNKLNFFITDMIALLISWTTKKLHSPKEEEAALLSDLLKFVIKNVSNPNKEVFKYNLELLQIMLTVWKDVIKVPSSLLLDMISYTQRKDSSANGTGFTILEMILSNELVPWIETNKVLYINSILSNIENDNTGVYRGAAYALGAFLVMLPKAGDQASADNLFEETRRRLQVLNGKKDHKSEKRFMEILYKIHKSTPNIIDSFRDVICFKIPTTVGAAKRLYLEMVLSRIESFDEDEVYNTIIGIGIKDLLKHGDHQLMALHILNRSIPMLKRHDIDPLFDLVKESLTLQKTECREVAYEVCIYIAQNYTTSLRDQALEMLLKGVIDPNVEIQKRIYQFWSKDANLSPKIVERLLYFLEQYSTDCKFNFLCLCTQLILDPAIGCGDAKKQIFAFEDDRDAKLHEYHINTKSRGRTSYTMPPLFSESQQSRSSLFKATQLCSLVRNTNADYVFEPTQDPTSITQARQKFTLQSQSSLPFVTTQILNRRSQMVATESSTPTSSNRLRRRFIKDTEKEKSHQVLKVIEMKQRKVDQENQKSKENIVGLYRRYRYGEYPDLLINNLAFLLPLQALARRDVSVAKHLFVSICTAIFEADQSNSVKYLQQFEQIFQTVLHKSKIFDSITIAAFLEVSLLKPSALNLPADKVATVAKLTNNEIVCALYLEDRLIADWDDDNSSKLETLHWMHLSGIYNSLKEYEIVSAISLDKIRTDPKIAKAIELKANGRADEAQTLLLEVMGNNVHVEHFYAYNCFYECCMELGNWSYLTEAVKNEINNIEELWSDDYSFNNILPKMVHANIQLALEGKDEPIRFCETIKSWLNVPMKSEFVKNELCEEFMMLLIFSQNFRRCKVLYETHMKKFLKDWSVFSSFHTKTKLETLLNNKRMSEIDYYVQLFLDGFDENSVEKLCYKWDFCHIDPTESLHQWNTVIGYRKYVATLGSKILQDAQIVGPQEKLEKMIYNMNLKIFEIAEGQNNFALAQKFYERLIPNESDATQLLMHKLSKIKNIYLQSQRSDDIQRPFETVWNTITIMLHDELLGRHHNQHVEILGLKAKMLVDIIEKLENQQFDYFPEADLRDIVGLLPSEDFHGGLIKIALRALKDAAWLTDGTIVLSENFARVDSFVKLAQFCYDRLDSFEPANLVFTHLQKLFIHWLLKAMRYGSKEARQLFPCILQLPFIENGLLHNYFKKHTSDVPEWTYLGWIPQILSRMLLSEKCYLDDIVHNIAMKHPDAIRYPFAIWHKEAKFQLSRTQSMRSYTDRSNISVICEVLHNRLCDRFIRSFKYLAIPEAYLSAQLESFERDIRSHSNITDEQFKNLTQRLLEDVYCVEESFQGVAYRRLLKYKTDLQNLKELSFARDEERIRKTLIDVAQSLRGYLRKTHSLTIETSVQLENICPWLSTYQWCGDEDSIELPGQFANISLEMYPDTLAHTKIVRFNSKIRVLVSQRYPLRITIHGSNGHNYDYLVKHGEDLKQDQRIQQILELMSQKLREDKSCQRHNLFIRTYSVVPIHRNCGILSWVGDTVSLHDFIFNCFSRRCPNSNEIIEQTTKNYLEFIGRPSHASQNTSNLTVYGTAASKYTREQFIQHQRALENRIDHDILKKALMDIAISPGGFFALRSNFATSLAAMNIAHWILGVGDRHLQNTLISIKDGSVTGIDFGFTFGSGTRDQKVPELTPFRLTTHLVNVMSPMGTSGLIHTCMVYALKVFRRADRVLLACMEVFIREPSINWLDTAMNRMNEDDEVVLRAWEPKDRVDIAKCKLQGFNPMYLFERELNVGLISKNIEFLAGYMRILRGHLQFNERSRLKRDKLIAEDQVNCLIDQATDPAILGISYVGFAPWI